MDEDPGAATRTDTVDRQPEPDYGQVVADAERTLDELDAALVRIDRGTYGICETCGRPLPDEQLAASPTARTCVEHAEYTHTDAEHAAEHAVAEHAAADGWAADGSSASAD